MSPHSSSRRRFPSLGRLPLASYLSLIVLSVLPTSRAFTFAFNDTGAATCDTVEVTWRGGTPPFHLLIIPAFDYPSTHKISNSSYNGETGTYDWQVDYPAGTNYVAVMSDSGGIATGGVSSIMQVDTQKVNRTCPIRESKADGFFYLDPQDGVVGQCQNLGIGWDSNVTDPILLGVIPNGNAFVLPIQDSPWEWAVNVVGSGTQYILAMLDSGPYGQAGSSGFLTVNQTKEGSTTTCLDAASPSKTPGSQWGTPGGVAATTQKSAASSATSTSSPSASQPVHASRGLSTALIVGIAVASVIAVAACQGLFFWFCCRNRFRRTLASNPVDLFSSKHEGEHVGDAPVASRSRFFGRERDLSTYQPEPYLHVPAGSADHIYSPTSNSNLASSPSGRPLHDEQGRDPFDDDGGYLIRRGSEGTMADSPGLSPSQSGINLRSLSSSQPSPLSPRHSQRPFPVHSDSQDERLLPSSPGYDSPSNYIDSPTALTNSTSPSNAHFSYSHSAQLSHHSQLRPLSTTTPPPHLHRSSSDPPSPSVLSSTPSMVRNTKQMLALSNPDRELVEDTGPGPSYLRHTDSGPMEDDGPGVARTGETVELPPLYDDLQPRRTS